MIINLIRNKSLPLFGSLRTLCFSIVHSVDRESVSELGMIAVDVLTRDPRGSVDVLDALENVTETMIYG